MKKIFMFMSSVFLASPIYADAITDGISTAGDAVYSYTSYVQAFGYVLSCIIGIVGAFVIYYAIANNEAEYPQASSDVGRWMCHDALYDHRIASVLQLSGRSGRWYVGRRR